MIITLRIRDSQRKIAMEFSRMVKRMVKVYQRRISFSAVTPQSARVVLGYVGKWKLPWFRRELKRKKGRFAVNGKYSQPNTTSLFFSRSNCLKEVLVTVGWTVLVDRKRWKNMTKKNRKPHDPWLKGRKTSFATPIEIFLLSFFFLAFRLACNYPAPDAL